MIFNEYTGTPCINQFVITELNTTRLGATGLGVYEKEKSQNGNA